MAKSADQVEIAPGHRVAEWRALALDPSDPSSRDWVTAISIFRQRIESRFLEPADCLVKDDANRTRGTFGFAILALDFLVVETIQGFREGVANHNGRSSALVRRFLVDWAGFTAGLTAGDDAVARASQLYSQGRCALHHAGSTDGITLRRSGPMLSFSATGREITINRSAFHEGVKGEFERYLRDLAAVGNDDLRRNFITRMSSILQDVT